MTHINTTSHHTMNQFKKNGHLKMNLGKIEIDEQGGNDGAAVQGIA